MSLFARYGEAARPTQDLDLATRRLPNTPVRSRRCSKTSAPSPSATA
ncbi:hypothetical protein ACI3L1_19410 [Deinococcus sp. SM5_A1]